ncbi:MAG: molybdopterin-dependent oxidoreductase, partial [Actinomycetota bacterium]|nr:molybdopterin-dependent oxidoreductase [Actinomycetota bacterium]
SGDPSAMPVTQWFTDPVLQLDPSRWRLQVAGRRLALDELRAGNDVLRATLDCTNGWYAEQEWRGVRLDRLLGDSRGRSIDVVSATGYSRRLPLRDASHLLLATHAAGRPLSAGHGAPVRLVAPGRRGFWWVKWVARIEVVDAPWWVAPPFPLQ